MRYKIRLPDCVKCRYVIQCCISLFAPFSVVLGQLYPCTEKAEICPV